MRPSVFAGIASIFVAASAHGGAWTQPAGHGQVILNGFYSTSHSYYDNRGRKFSQPAYSKYEINPYIEYGLTDSITLGANLSAQAAKQSDYFNTGLGDSEFFARLHVAEIHGLQISLQPLVKLPSPESRDEFPMIGSRHPDGEIGLSLGYGFDLFGQHHFANLDTAYRHRLGAPKDQLRLSPTLGIGLSQHWMVLPQLFITRRTDAPANAGFTQSTGDDYSETKLQLSAVYRMNSHLTLQAGAFSQLKGKNTGSANGVLLGVWRSF